MRLTDFIKRAQRGQYLKQAKGEAMCTLLTSDLPSSRSFAADSGYLVADLEMTGLDARQDSVVSIGWVAIQQREIQNASARHYYFNNADVDLQQSAPIHKIRNIDLQQGHAFESVLSEFLIALSNRALVLHCASLDLAFLNRTLKHHFEVGLAVPVVDTMQVEKRRLERQGNLASSSLTLSACRRRYNLPVYTAHNAAIDALATAELWLAQLAHSGCHAKTRLADYL